jgi:hypothetical protein
MSRKKSFTEKLTKRLKKQNLKKHAVNNKPRYIAKADRVTKTVEDTIPSEITLLENQTIAFNASQKGE